MEKQTSHRPDREIAGPLYGKDPWPLRFHTHSFGAVCFNTLACSIIYCRRQFGTRAVGYDGIYIDKPSGPAPLGPWRDRWVAHHAASLVEGRTFSTPLSIDWTSLDGHDHAVELDLDEVFEDLLVLHEVARDQVKETWLSATSSDPVSPHVLVEVNDRTVSLYMRAMVATEAEQIPGNDKSYFRDDLILAWAHTYDFSEPATVVPSHDALLDEGVCWSEGLSGPSYRPHPDLAGPLYGKEPWPLRFHTHGFGAVCFNTLTCSIIYHGHEFGTRKLDAYGNPYDRPSGSPPDYDWQEGWRGSHGFVAIEGRTFSDQVEIHWTSLDGVDHVTLIDFDEIFGDRLVLHEVRRDEVKEAWLDAASIDPVSPAIMVEVNDHIINVYMRAMVVTEAEQIPGNRYSHFRSDLILAWTNSY